MSTCIKDLIDYDLVKKCLKCGNISLKIIFHNDKNREDGLQPHCKSCKKEYRRKYYIEHHDLELECHKKYRSDTKDKIIEYFKTRKKSDSKYKLSCNL